MSSSNRSKGSRLLLGVSLMLVFALLLAGCGGSNLTELPLVGQFFAAPEPPTPTPAPTPTNTPEPTATPRPGETPIPATPTPVPTPQVTIPDGFSPVVDDVLGYSFAVPRGWSPLDLRSASFQNMANTLGLGSSLAPLNDFLATEAGDQLGKIYITDLMAAMTGGLPTALVVYVLPAPGATAASAVDFVEGMLESNSGMLGDVNVEAMTECTVNNLPAVCGTATANLANFGFAAELFAKVVGQVANDNIYVMALVTQGTNRASKEPVFDQIIGTFRPE